MSSSTIRCNPRICPSTRFNRAISACFSAEYPCGPAGLASLMLSKIPRTRINPKIRAAPTPGAGPAYRAQAMS
ncbi:hypothetical protein GCM10025331_58650 [Actinoplanes utahensis]|nr:hypothetical protein Aut01nite_70640 [Actinoplanes utahensis]